MSGRGDTHWWTRGDAAPGTGGCGRGDPTTRAPGSGARNGRISGRHHGTFRESTRLILHQSAARPRPCRRQLPGGWPNSGCRIEKSISCLPCRSPLGGARQRGSLDGTHANQNEIGSRGAHGLRGGCRAGRIVLVPGDPRARHRRCRAGGLGARDMARHAVPIPRGHRRKHAARAAAAARQRADAAAAGGGARGIRPPVRGGRRQRLPQSP